MVMIVEMIHSDSVGDINEDDDDDNFNDDCHGDGNDGEGDQC